MVIDYRESERALNRFAGKVARRLKAAGAPVHMIEDLKQELWVAWCIARDTYREDAPASFATYFAGGMRLHINRWVEKNVSRRHSEVIAKSLDASLGDDDDKGSKLHEVLPAADPSPSENIENEDSWNFALANLSPKSALFLELLRNPPEELLQQVRQIEARSRFAKHNGHTIPFVNRVTTAMVFSLMDVSKPERTKITAEINKLGGWMREANL